MSILLQFEKLPYPAADCTGKTFIVIGANVGIGKEAVRHFVRLNASKVILGVRSIERGEAAKADIEATTKRTEVGVMEVWEIDLSRYASVKSFASKVATLPRVDAVVSNASIATTDWEVFEGHESTITVNVISTMLLVLLLLPTMRASAEKFDIVPIVDVVCSDIHHWSPFRERNAPNIFAEISDKNRADMSIERYQLSKLLQLLAAREIATRMGKKPKVVLNIINPGLAKTKLTRNTRGFLKWQMIIMKALLARSAEGGSRMLVHAVTDAGPESHGLYFSNCDIKRNTLSPFVTSPEGQAAQKKVWKELAEILEGIQPGVTANIQSVM